MPDHALSNLVLDEMLEGFNHDQKKTKHLEGVFFDSDNLYTIPKKPKSAFFFREKVSSAQLLSKKGPFELTNEKLLMIN